MQERKQGTTQLSVEEKYQGTSKELCKIACKIAFKIACKKTRKEPG